MILYRFTRAEYSKDISGEGAKLFGGRWNNKGNAVLYSSVSISLALLELLIHSAAYDEIRVNQLVTIDTGNIAPTSLELTQLKDGWQNDVDYSKFIGDEFLRGKSSLLMQVPSAIIPEESNVLINPSHADFKKVKIKSVRDFRFDVRMFKT